MQTTLACEKLGMTRVYVSDKDSAQYGHSIPVTVLQVHDHAVSQIKKEATDGYSALQLATMNAKRSNKPLSGHFAKAKLEAKRVVFEVKVTEEEAANAELSQVIGVAVLDGAEYIDVTGTSKGKGFAGPVKRWNFSMQDATHGNSISHRAHGSTGQCQDPGRVFKGKKMAGHLGAVKRTAQSLEVVRVDADKKLILVKGSVPGFNGSVVFVKPSVKKGAKA